jgi:hypothetical protein
MSLHGMAVADGVWLLIERHWIDRTADLRRRWTEAVFAAGLRLFDWDRRGEKGFHYIGPGFGTTPEGRAMREHFTRSGDRDTAALFYDSSMEHVRSLGGDPLCLVTELPLFVLTRQIEPGSPGEPRTYRRFREDLPKIRMLIERGDLHRLAALLEPYGLEPLPLPTAVALQAKAIEFGLEAINGPE